LPLPQPVAVVPPSSVTPSSLPEDTHALAPAVEDWPLGQVAQLEEPVEAAYSPALQPSQLLAPVAGW
jgi:hypothetical protein